ncbi:MAG TPA: secretin N-terminal domain-containing protein, partial [Candidatus Binatia bacterium]
MGRVLASVMAVGVLVLCAGTYAQGQPPAAPVDVVPAPSPSPAARASATDDSVVLNFEGADIREVIHSLADALGINYQIDPRIQGQVTIRTTGTIGKQDLFPVFNQILRSNGISAVKVGDIYQIMPVAEAKTKAIIPTKPNEKNQARHEDAFVIEVVPVEHVAAQEMVNVIQPFITPGGDVIPYPRANLLIITDLESNVARLKDLVVTFDRDAFRDLRARVYKIEHANIEEIGQELLAILDTYGVTPSSGEERGIYVIPLPRLNSVVVVAFNPTAFAEIDRWMKVLDVPPEEGAGRLVHVYAVENAKAADLAEILNQLYGGGSQNGSTTSNALGRSGYTPFGSRQRGGANAAPGARQNAAGRPPAVVRPGPGAPTAGNALQNFDDFSEFAQPQLQQFSNGSGSSSGSTSSLGGGSSSSSRSGFGSGTGRGSSSGSGSFGNNGAGGQGQGQGQGIQGYVLAGGEPGDIFRQEVRIVADEVSNSLVVLATKKDYADISEVLHRLDIVPRQVLIEVLVAEVDLGDDLKFGIEWSLAGDSRKDALGRITGESTTTSGSQTT